MASQNSPVNQVIITGPAYQATHGGVPLYNGSLMGVHFCFVTSSHGTLSAQQKIPITDLTEQFGMGRVGFYKTFDYTPNNAKSAARRPTNPLDLGRGAIFNF